MQNFGNFNDQPAKKTLLNLVIISTLILFIFTGLTQFSCYPMVTNGALPKFCNNPKNKLEIINNPKTNWQTLYKIAKDRKSDEDTLRKLTKSLDEFNLFENVRKKLERTLTENTNTPTDILDAFVESDDVGILKIIAERTNASPELLRKVAKNPILDSLQSDSLQNDQAKEAVTDLGRALVNNRNTPDDVLPKLAKSKEPYILYDIANPKNPSTNFKASANVLREIANNPFADNLLPSDDKPPQFKKYVKMAVASNPNTPEDVLLQLADSKDIDVLKVSANVIASPNVLRKIADNLFSDNLLDSEQKVKSELANNSNTPEDILFKLAELEDPEILNSLVKTKYPSVLNRIGENKIFDSDVYLQRSLAENPYISARITEKLAVSKDLKTLIYLSLNPNISRKAIEQLIQSGYQEVIDNLFKKNDNVPSDLKEECRKLLQNSYENLKAQNSSEDEPVPIKMAKKDDNKSVQPNIQFPQRRKNCTGEHIRNNLFGLAAGTIGLFFSAGNPVVATLAYGAVTSSLEAKTSVLGCQ
jgi:hypothetical protein